MSATDETNGRDWYCETFSMQEAAAIGRVEATRIRSWISRGVLPNLGRKHPKLGAWLFSLADLVRIRVAGQVLDLTGDTGLANALSLGACLRLADYRDNLRGFVNIAGRNDVSGFVFASVDGAHRFANAEVQAKFDEIVDAAHIAIPTDTIIRQVLADARELLAND